MVSQSNDAGYRFASAEPSHTHGYLMPTVERVLQEFFAGRKKARVLDLGCGNGATAAHLNGLGYDVMGVDPSEKGIAWGRSAYPHLRLFHGSAYDNLVEQHGRFPVVISLEVVEHVYSPRRFAATLRNLVEKDGLAIISTPYHSYWKNLAMAATGRMDQHFTALWDHGHIKFWSRKTLGALLHEVGFEMVSFTRVGRIPTLAKSMIAMARG